MEPGPLPPHERVWRHPSELGPPPHEPTTTAGKALIVTSAAVGLIMVGILAVAVVPNRGATPTAVESTEAPVRANVVAASALAASSSVRTDVAAMAVVTPVGDGGLAITTLEAVAGLSRVFMARLPNGEAIRVVVVGTDEASGLALVALPKSARTAGEGFQMADDQPDPSDTVVLHGVQTTIVAVVELSSLDVAEGTPVLDGAGDLVGLCSEAERGTKLVPLTPDKAADGIDSSPAPDSASPDTTIAGEPSSTATTSTETTDVSSSYGASEPRD